MMSLSRLVAGITTGLTIVIPLIGFSQTIPQVSANAGVGYNMRMFTPMCAINSPVPYENASGLTSPLARAHTPTVLTEIIENVTKPVGVDLDVTYVRRTPLYNRYQVVWQDELPILAPGTEDDKRWPDYGESVTFTAHFKNKGTVASGSFQYRWYIDDAEVGSGTWPNLDPGQEGMTTHNWSWDHTTFDEQLQGQHTVTFKVDPDDLVPETYESNNAVADRTDALSLCYQIKPEVYEALETPVDSVWPFSAEDWIKKQVMALNDAFDQSVHPLSQQEE